MLFASIQTNGKCSGNSGPMTTRQRCVRAPGRLLNEWPRPVRRRESRERTRIKGKAPMAKLRLFRLAAAIIPFIPLWLAYPGARLIGRLIWAFGGERRRRVERNLRHIPTLMGDPVALHRAARGVFEHMTLNYLDFLRGSRLTPEQVLAGWTTEGEELITELVSQGRGL